MHFRTTQFFKFFKKLVLSGKFYLPVAAFFSLVIFLGATLFSFTSAREGDNLVANQVKQNFLRDLTGFKEQARGFVQQLEAINQNQVTLPQVQASFYKTKQAYKKTEYLLEYLDPDLGKSLNGAPIPRVAIEHQNYLALGFKEPAHVTFPPEGLQVIEEILFAEDMKADDIKKVLSLAYRLQERTTQFLGGVQGQSLTDKQILGSLRDQLVRVITLGLTGFDSPAAGKEINNAATALEPVLAAAQLYAGKNRANTGSDAPDQLKLAIDYLQQHPDFDAFDRLYFIRELAEPAYAALIQLENKILSPTSATTLSKPVNEKATGIFSADFLQPGYYAKEDRENQKKPLLNLGKALFFDPVLSANNQRACASCHVPAKAFTDGRPKSISFDDKGTVPRNSPTLLNAVFSKAYFWDGRADFLQDQVPGVLTQADELHGSYEEVVLKLNLSKDYQQLFKQAFKNLPAQKSINTNTINRALAAYIQTLVALNSPFDKYMRRETEILPAAAKRGFNLFMGKAACGTCHFAPVFNGTVPPRYLESETEVLGVTATANLEKPVLDKDLGRGNIIKAAALNHSFKTPTVRNAGLTQPYMHNGAFATLAEVVEFYNQGGGAGLGLNIPNQTLPASPLNLTEEEKKDMVSFMEALTDTAFAREIPAALPRFPVKTGLNQRPIGGRY
jgi:cytochrome c peroxidase